MGLLLRGEGKGRDGKGEETPRGVEEEGKGKARDVEFPHNLFNPTTLQCVIDLMMTH